MTLHLTLILLTVTCLCIINADAKVRRSTSWYVEVLPKRFSYQGNKETLPSTWPVFPTIESANDVITVQEQSIILSNGNLYIGDQFQKISIRGGISFNANGSKLFKLSADESSKIAEIPEKLRNPNLQQK